MATDNCARASGTTIGDRGFNPEYQGGAALTCVFSSNAGDPKLAAALADNGGPTQTLALNPGSAAIETGACTTIAGVTNSVDQRGEPRPGVAGKPCDIGAFEVQIPTIQTATITLTAGWNLISLPLNPTTPLDARTVLTSLIALTHGNYAEIDNYTNGQFAPSLYDDPGDHLGIGGTNFTLQLGHGYALYTDSPGTISVTGVPVTAAASLALTAGWNLVGFPDAGTTTYKAYDVLTTLLAATHGNYAEIDSYANGQFLPSAFDDPADKLGLNGTNFTMQPGHEYALYTDTGTLLRL